MRASAVPSMTSDVVRPCPVGRGTVTIFFVRADVPASVRVRGICCGDAYDVWVPGSTACHGLHQPPNGEYAARIPARHNDAGTAAACPDADAERISAQDAERISALQDYEGRLSRASSGLSDGRFSRLHALDPSLFSLYNALRGRFRGEEIEERATGGWGKKGGKGVAAADCNCSWGCKEGMLNA